MVKVVEAQGSTNSSGNLNVSNDIPSGHYVVSAVLVGRTGFCLVGHWNNDGSGWSVHVQAGDGSAITNTSVKVALYYI